MTPLRAVPSTAARSFGDYRKVIMSKESKSRDRFRQSIEAVRDRPQEYCPGCGYYHIVNGEHRIDCTAKPRIEADQIA